MSAVRPAQARETIGRNSAAAVRKQMASHGGNIMKRLFSTLIVAFLVVLGMGLARDYRLLTHSYGAHASLDPAVPADRFPLGNSSERIAERLQVYLGSPPKSKPKKRIRVAQAATPAKSDGQTDDLLIEAEKMLGPEGSQSNAKKDKPKSEEPASTENAAKKSDGGDDALSASEQHLALFVENRYPAAATCGICHPKHYKEWSVSQHAYAQLSPVYLSLNNKINELSNGSNGDFCLRCHNPVGANLGESTFESNLDRHPTSREGITCVVCHRINKNYNKVSGRLALVEG